MAARCVHFSQSCDCVRYMASTTSASGSTATQMPGGTAPRCSITSPSRCAHGAHDALSGTCGAACHPGALASLQAVIDGSVLCVHGGLSPDVRTLDQVRMIDRVCEIPHEGPFCDLMWSDPEDIDSWAVSPRGAGWSDAIAQVPAVLLRRRNRTAVLRRLAFWRQSRHGVQPSQQPGAHMSCPSACAGVTVLSSAAAVMLPCDLG